jgi:cell division protease FtsH
LALILLIQWAASTQRYEKVSYGRFRQLLVDGQVREARLTSDKVRGLYVSPGGEGKPKGFIAVREPNDDKLAELLQQHLGANWDVQTSWLESPLLYFIVPLVLIVVLWRFLLGRANPMSSVMDFSQSRAMVIAQKDVGVTFDDVAGIEECKQELEEVVEFLRNPSKFTRLGGRIPKGVLLVGPPGTGKTLLAKAVAGEANVTFFSLSGSDFVEMFVGVGAARVRDLFEQAHRNAPSIIFIDELDALGKARGAGPLGGHDEREQTLNALLVQMDGFTTQKGVIILAATNRPEMLDPALLRPGRFDRQIVVPPPDLQDRKAILKVHTAVVKLDGSVDLDRLAAMTPGFVGADLANLVNEATLLAARRNKDAVSARDFEDSVERVVVGLEKRNRLMNESEKEIVAHHEAGHALVACMLPGVDPVHKVSMIPRGMAALGYTMQRPTEDRYLLRKSELNDRLAVMLGGRSAEEVAFGEVSTGAHNDLQKATELAREMVTQFGMSEELGPLSYVGDQSRLWEAELGISRMWSERTSQQVDKAVRALVEAAHKRALELLAGHRDALVAVASALRESEVIAEDRLHELLARYGVPVASRPRGAAAGTGTEAPQQTGQTARQEAQEPAPDSGQSAEDARAE